MAASKAEYHTYLQDMLNREGMSRDEAVRATNIHFGYGSSTALQHDVSTDPDTPSTQPHDKGGGEAA
jgi:hypothetical protein